MNLHAPPAASTAAPWPLGVRLPREFAFSAGWLLLGLLFFSGVTLACRRWAGALADPPCAASLLGAGLGAAAAATLARRLQRGHPSRRLQRLAAWTPCAALGLFGIALTFPGTSPAAIGVFWAILLAEEAWALGIRSGRTTGASPRQVPPSPAQESRCAVLSASSADQVMQHFERAQGRNGVERISGWLRIPVAAGQRTVTAHVAFCPPLRCVPAWALRQNEGPKARIRTTQLMAYGARIEMKLDASPAQPVEIVVRFDGHTEAGNGK